MGADASVRSGNVAAMSAWAVAALVACLLLALRSTGTAFATRGLAEDFTLSRFDDQAAWVAFYYLMWAVLTPLVFATVRRRPIEHGNWVRPLLFHLPVSVAVSVAASVVLSILFGGLWLQRGWPTLDTLLSPFWTQYAALRAFNDTTMYWIVLGAGHAIRYSDDARIRRLEAATLERALVSAQVDALRMKLQPHFLFNTLNSISFLAIERDTASVVAMVERLGSLLRASMASNGRQLVPLDEELALLDEYLAIEELRFKDRLQVVRRIDPAARAARVPSLVLQPIIENSIKHGFSRRLDAHRLEIDIAREADALVVTVTDDGPGLPEGWDLATHCGRGLRNVLERLDALYRGAWSFSLENATGGGAVARLRIPAGG